MENVKSIQSNDKSNAKIVAMLKFHIITKFYEFPYDTLDLFSFSKPELTPGGWNVKNRVQCLFIVNGK